MKKNIKKIISIILIITIFITISIPSIAQDNTLKDEVVYVNLNGNGTVKDINVVNVYSLETDSKIYDYGDYSTVKNLTATDEIAINNNDLITTNAPKGKFYYQGTLKSKKIPWDVSISYTLDGKAIEAEKLAGSNGHLVINVDLKQNKFNSIYTDNFALQATITLDSELCKNIKAPDATIANAGNNKQISYIVLPKKSKSFSINADVENFEMDSIQINAIPLSLSIDDPDTAEIKDKVSELQDGAIDLDDGSIKLYDGATELKNGVLELKDGAQDLDDGALDIFDGTKDLKEGVSDLTDGANKLANGANDIKNGFSTLNSNSSQLKQGVAQYQQQALLSLQALGITVAMPSQQENSLNNTSYLIQMANSLNNSLSTSILQLEQQIKNIPVGSSSSELIAILSTKLSALYQQKQINSLTLGTLQYIYATEQLGSGFNTFYDGFNEFKGGIYELHDGANDLYDGAEELYDGTKDLKDGVNSLYDGTLELRDGIIELNDGTFELRDKTSDMDTEIDNRIDDLLDEYRNKDFKMISFVSEKNTNVDSVQFVIKTAEIKIIDAKITQPAKTNENTILNRIVNLFPFLKNLYNN